MDETQWQPFHYKLTIAAIDTTQENLMMREPVEDWLQRITNVAFVNATSATTYARLRVFDGVIEHFHREWRTLTAGLLYYDNTLELPLALGEVAGVAFFGATAGDILTVFIRGERRKLP